MIIFAFVLPRPEARAIQRKLGKAFFHACVFPVLDRNAIVSWHVRKYVKRQDLCVGRDIRDRKSEAGGATP